MQSGVESVRGSGIKTPASTRQPGQVGYVAISCSLTQTGGPAISTVPPLFSAWRMKSSRLSKSAKYSTASSCPGMVQITAAASAPADALVIGQLVERTAAPVVLA